MIRNSTTYFLSTLLIAGAFSVSQAATIALYDMDDGTSGTPETTSFNVNPDAASTAANLTASTITYGGSTPGDFWRVSNANTLVLSAGTGEFSSNVATALTNGAFAQLTLTVDPGYELDLNSVSFLVGKGGDSGTRNWGVASSLSGSTLLASVTDNTTPEFSATPLNPTIDLTESGFGDGTFQNITGSVTFQFIAATDDTFRTMVYDDIEFDGTVTVIPEPSTLGVMGLAFGLFAMLYRRSRRS